MARVWYRRASGLPAALADPADDAEALEATRMRLEQRESQLATHRARLERERAQLDEARSQADHAHETEVVALREELARARRDLDRAQRQDPQLEVELESLRSELERAQRELDEVPDLEAELASLVSALEHSHLELEQAQRTPSPETRAELESLRGEIGRLRDELDEARREPPAESLPGPSIRIIEPELGPPTRGVQVSAVEVVGDERVVIGAVEAPAGLLRVLVNDRRQGVSGKGLFEARIPTRASDAKVRVVAVDLLGRRAVQEFLFRAPARSQTGTVGSQPSTDSERARSEIDFGSYHALVIGNDEYVQLPKLTTANNDATEVASVLRERFGFQVTLLANATRYQILSALNELRARLTSDDNLLLYYAGHGQLDEVNMRGHWLPVDAHPENTANWLSNVAITDILNAMNARHVMVVSDSCYSGSLTRSALSRPGAGLTDQEKLTWRKAMASKRSRTALTSGGLAPVLDAGGGEHSVFAKILLEVLRSSSEIVEGQRLYHQIAARVAHLAERYRFEQLPQYAPIKFSGHESGDFFFVPVE
jgi:hypothetical protein